ncbi:uncharacterized protein LOC128093026 [Culex pipiens pallens]|uniref:uncharacterized protein LOC128093026 n=1 Tax=Culex pipiens pallens TaxID=42434 RepID=UPI0022AA65EA|nr:uncharacterized protein LOC128093026 [Culex pipiens pallens]
MTRIESSLTPEIYGHLVVKKALLIGDHGVAKAQMMGYIDHHLSERSCVERTAVRTHVASSSRTSNCQPPCFPVSTFSAATTIFVWPNTSPSSTATESRRYIALCKRKLPFIFTPELS